MTCSTLMVEVPDWSEAEIRNVALNLLLAGYETTAKLVGLALVALEQHPEQRSLLAEQPELDREAVEEVPVGGGRRIVMLAGGGAGRRVLAGTPLAPGDVLYLNVRFLRTATRRAGRIRTARRAPTVQAQPRGSAAGSTSASGRRWRGSRRESWSRALLRLAPEYRLRDVDYGSGFFARGPKGGLIEVGVSAVA